MTDDTKNKTTDLLGLAPYGDALKISVEKGFGAAEAVLSRICLPAAEELGLMFKDKVRYWRLNNIIKVINKSSDKLKFENNQIELNAHPKVVNEIMENASWIDDESLQNMWAGLLASSCNKANGDDANLLYTNILKQLTSTQAKLLNYMCSNCTIKTDKHGLVWAEHLTLTKEQLMAITNITDIYRIDAELDYMRSIELLTNDLAHGAGICFGQNEIIAELEPSPFALSLFVKAQGFKGTPKEYFNLEYKDPQMNK